ncbi:hypothetical protein GOV04_02100 [Candidatus Woesearchaeota archaeon]|nr:hypothetical protein [Candidatus Woesearchaeota archaeon]
MKQITDSQWTSIAEQHSDTITKIEKAVIGELDCSVVVTKQDVGLKYLKLIMKSADPPVQVVLLYHLCKAFHDNPCQHVIEEKVLEASSGASHH